MKNIKYRIWASTVNYFADDSNVFFLSPNGKIWDANLRGFRDDLIPSLSTGVKDKLGVEVYEGDILDCSDGPAKVVYVPNGADYEVWFADGGKISLYAVSDFKGVVPCVVGNIYESPEMVVEEDND